MNRPTAIGLEKGRPAGARRPFARRTLARARSSDRLDRLEVQRAGCIVASSGLIGKALADRRETILFPPNRALFEREYIAADFRLDFAVALDRVE